MHDWFQKHKQYYTEVAGPWQTRQCDPSEYEAQAQELIQIADKMPPYHTTEITWCRQQAKILQNRVDYIRQEQANQLAKQQAAQAREQATKEFNERLATINATLQAMQQTTQQITQYSTQQSTSPTPPAPQEAQKEEDKQPLQQAIVEENAESTAEKQEQQPLYQATVEDITESTTESTTKDGNSMAVSKSTLSTFPRLCTTPTSGNSAAYLSNARFCAYQQTSLLSLLNTLPGYIKHSEGMEATGQG